MFELGLLKGHQARMDFKANKFIFFEFSIDSILHCFANFAPRDNEFRSKVSVPRRIQFVYMTTFMVGLATLVFKNPAVRQLLYA